MSDIRNSQKVSIFNNYTVSSLARNDLGIKDFSEVSSKIEEIKQMIDEMIVIIDKTDSIPNGITAQIYTYIDEFNFHGERITNYSLDSDARSNFNERTQIIASVHVWYDTAYGGGNTGKGYGFIVLYNSLKMYNLLSLQKDKTDIEGLKNDLTNSNEKATELLNLLQSRVTSVAVSDYAGIFEQQALKHSQFKIWPLKEFKVGLAQVWLLVAILLVIGFAYLVKHENEILPFDVSNPNTTIITLQLLTRILVISFTIYLISLAFKQYNVQNHLQTLNKHRQNTLNSYKLFIESLDGSDPVTKNALMLEVAKSIYEAGPSGYLSNKDGDSSPSILELTKFVGQPK